MNNNYRLPPGQLTRGDRENYAELVPQPYSEAHSYATDAPEDTEGLLYYWRILRRHKAMLLLAATLGALVAVAITLPQTPVYQAKVSVEIQGLNEDFLNMKSVNTTSNSNSDPSSELQTQVRILQSRALLERVIGKLDEDSRDELTADTGRISAWRKALHLSAPAPATEQAAVRMAARNITIKPVINSRIVDILCDSIDSRLAANFANAMAQEYITDSVESRYRSTQNTGEFLTKEINDLKIKLEKSEGELQAYMRTAGLFLTGDNDKENVADEKLRQLQKELLTAQADRVSKQSRYEMAKSIPAESLPEVLDDDTLKEYRSKLGDLRRQLAELSYSLTPVHYKVQRVQAQIAEIEIALQKDRGNILTRIGNEYEGALRREKLLAADYAAQKQLVLDQADKLIHYNILKREVDTNRQLYESMLQRVKETGIAAAMRASGIRVIDPAVPPGAPYKPNLIRSAEMGLLGGLLLGTILILLREKADRSLQQPGDAAFYLNVPELGVIPSAPADRKGRIRGRHLAPASLASGSDSAPNGGELVPIDHSRVELITWARKPSLVSEAFRTTLTSLLFSARNGDRPRVIVLTSAGPGEGKTTVTINLAIALTEISQRVLLIDADMRRPRVHEILELGSGVGLADMLREKEPLDGRPLVNYIHPTQIPGLHAVRSGRTSGTVSNLFHSPRLLELLKRLRSEYDSILIDSPPVLHLSDARVLGRLADAVILVLKAGQTTRDSALMAKQHLAEDGTIVLGTILNQWNPKHAAYGYRYDYGAYHAYHAPKAREEGAPKVD